MQLFQTLHSLGNFGVFYPFFIYCYSKHDKKKNNTIYIKAAKIVSEYDQEIPQSQTADYPVAPQGL